MYHLKLQNKLLFSQIPQLQLIMFLVEFDCEAPGEGTNTEAVDADNTKYSDTFKCQCLDGFDTEEETPVVCQIDDKWNSDPAACGQCRQCELDLLMYHLACMARSTTTNMMTNQDALIPYLYCLIFLCIYV